MPPFKTNFSIYLFIRLLHIQNGLNSALTICDISIHFRIIFGMANFLDLYQWAENSPKNGRKS